MTFSFTNQEYVILQTALEQASLHLQDLSNKAAANERFWTDQERIAKAVADSLVPQMIALSGRLNSELQPALMEEIIATRII